MCAAKNVILACRDTWKKERKKKYCEIPRFLLICEGNKDPTTLQRERTEISLEPISLRDGNSSLYAAGAKIFYQLGVCIESVFFSLQFIYLLKAEQLDILQAIEFHSFKAQSSVRREWPNDFLHEPTTHEKKKKWRNPNGFKRGTIFEHSFYPDWKFIVMLYRNPCSFWWIHRLDVISVALRAIVVSDGITVLILVLARRKMAQSTER